jgi:hypothetical protein
MAQRRILEAGRIGDSVKQTLRGLLVAVAGVAALGVYWLGKQILESLLGEVLKRGVDQTGEAGWGVVFLACGVSLLIAGPVVMRRENRRRAAADRKPRYGIVEFIVVVVGGIAFTLAGVAVLLGYW